jgi:2'-5' RNA ligase
MKGIASLLDPSTSSKVEQIWQLLETHCGLTGVRITPFPHFTWQVTEDYNLSALDAALKTITHQTPPFTIRTSGLGIFTGEHPVIYLPIVNNLDLVSLHKKLWGSLNGIAINPEIYYEPGQWIPHITVAYGDVNRENLLCAVECLAFEPINMEIRIDNISTLSQSASSANLVFRHSLEG